MRPAPAPAEWTASEADASHLGDSEEDIRTATHDLSQPELTPSVFLNMSAEEQWIAVANFQSKVRHGAARTLAHAGEPSAAVVDGVLAAAPPHPPARPLYQTQYQAQHSNQDAAAGAAAPHHPSPMTKPLGPPPLPPRAGPSVGKGAPNPFGGPAVPAHSGLGVPDNESEAVNVDDAASAPPGGGGSMWK